MGLHTPDRPERAGLLGGRFWVPSNWGEDFKMMLKITQSSCDARAGRRARAKFEGSRRSRYPCFCCQTVVSVLQNLEVELRSDCGWDYTDQRGLEGGGF